MTLICSQFCVSSNDVFDGNFEGRCPSKRRATQTYKVVNNKRNKQEQPLN
jgi:hypothetical protein